MGVTARGVNCWRAVSSEEFSGGKMSRRLFVVEAVFRGLLSRSQFSGHAFL